MAKPGHEVRLCFFRRSLHAADLAALRRRLRLRSRFSSQQRGEGHAQIMHGGRALAFGRGEIEVIDSPAVKRPACGIQQHRLRSDPGTQMPGELLIGIQQHRRLESAERGMLDGHITADLRVALDKVGGHLVSMGRGDLVHLLHKGLGRGAEGRDEKEQHRPAFLNLQRRVRGTVDGGESHVGSRGAGGSQQHTGGKAEQGGHDAAFSAAEPVFNLPDYHWKCPALSPT
jgi:hypothetical protein